MEIIFNYAPARAAMTRVKSAIVTSGNGDVVGFVSGRRFGRGDADGSLFRLVRAR